jgi:hypothetical protein
MDHLVALVVLLATGTSDRLIDVRSLQDFNHLRMPAHGTAYKGMMYGFLDDDWAIKNKDGSGKGGRSSPQLEGIPLTKIEKNNWKPYPFQVAGSNCRHHVGYGALWFSNSSGFLNCWDFDHIQEIVHSYLGPGDAMGRDMIISGVPLLKLMAKYPKAEKAAFDSVPISRNSCKTFLLTKKEKKFEIWDSIGLVYQNPGGYRTPTEVRNPQSLDSPFTEDFYAFIGKKDYYFVTESGKLYYAPSPKKDEKSRTTKALWDDAKRPIVAVIEDADNDKVWLFAKDKNAGAKLDLYFEMKDTIATKLFDPKKLRPVNVEGRAKLLLEYLPLITK